MVTAFDPTTGDLLWTTPVEDPIGGGPVVRPDGTVAIVTSHSEVSSTLVILDPGTGTPAAHPLGIAVKGIAGVTRDGTLLVDQTGGLVALDGEGTPLWMVSGVGGATVASDGTVLLFAAQIEAIDGTTGATKWSLPAPSPAFLLGGALTSDGGIVALLGDGTLFGASD